MSLFEKILTIISLGGMYGILIGLFILLFWPPIGVIIILITGSAGLVSNFVLLFNEIINFDKEP